MTDNPYAPPPPSPSPYGSGQQQNPYGSGQQQNPYGSGQQQNPYGSGQQQNPYGSAPPQNPYGGAQQNPYGSGPPQNPYGGAQQNPYAPPTHDGAWANPTASQFAPLAERGTRLGASIIDSALYMVVMCVFAVPGAMADSAALLGLGMVAFLGLAIYQMYLISTTGQSLAKAWLGIRIVREDGSPVDFVHGVLLRSWVLAVAGSIIPFVGLVDVLMIFGEERRCLHDHLASTKVIIAQ